MHEVSLCERVLRIIEAEAPVQGFARVNRVCLEVGILAGVEPDALRFGFDVVKAGSIAAHACLDIERVAGLGWCDACAAEVALAQRFDPCPRCGGFALRVLRGDEMRISALEVE
jgi:hydrogenase nickel incorporation protein HypA/HybF